jgi:biofilm PGA synthesis N-glycosyltransferase PgaC
VAAALNLVLGGAFALFGFSIDWGIAIAVVATLQLAFALDIDFGNARRAPLALLLGPIYPLAYWLISAGAALRAETVALVRGPRERRVIWDISRESLPGGRS